jgi:hypothetical protein
MACLGKFDLEYLIEWSQRFFVPHPAVTFFDSSYGLPLNRMGRCLVLTKF